MQDRMQDRQDRMQDRQEKHVLLAIFAGMLGGLAASWAMNQFMAGPGQKLHESLQSEDEKREQREQQQRQKESGQPREDATMKTADALTHAITGRRLSRRQKEAGGPIVHYAFGALMGGLYGALAETSCAATAGFGTVFGAALFLGADVIAVPALHLSEPSTKASQLANPLGAHLVYGATTELVRRTLRKIA